MFKMPPTLNFAFLGPEQVKIPVKIVYDQHLQSKPAECTLNSNIPRNMLYIEQKIKKNLL